MQKHNGISVREALSLDPINRLKIVGGHDGLDRVIKLVNVIEVPDIMDWLIDGEFLLTTGYSFREYPEMMHTLIPRMKKTNSAALAIKTKRYLDEIPGDLINKANEHAIPLLEVPYDLSFSEIIAPILGVVFNKQNKILQKLEQAHKNLMDLALNGNPLEDLCKETGNLISNPVAIMDDEGALIVNEDCPDQYKFALFFSEHGVEIKKEKLRIGNIKEVKYSLEYTEDTAKPITIKAIRIPIIADNYSYGHMVAIINSPFSETDILIMERAATIAALEFTKRRAVFEIEKSYYNDFLEILLSCDFDNISEIVNRGRVVEIDLELPTAVIIINEGSFNDIVKFPGQMNFKVNRSKEELLKTISLFTKKHNIKNVIAGIKGNNIVVVAGRERNNPSSYIETWIRELVEYIKITTTISPIQIKVGVGSSYQDIGLISRSFEEAREALKIAQLSEKTNIVFFDDLGFYKILSEKNRSDLEKYVEDFLQPLFEYDKNKKGDLMKTLETYYDTNRNLKLTSTKLFTHYNTVLYRIKIIEKLTGASLDKPKDALNLEIAVNILKMFRAENV